MNHSTTVTFFVYDNLPCSQKSPTHPGWQPDSHRPVTWLQPLQELLHFLVQSCPKYPAEQAKMPKKIVFNKKATLFMMLITSFVEINTKKISRSLKHVSNKVSAHRHSAIKMHSSCIHWFDCRGHMILHLYPLFKYKPFDRSKIILT